jgi:Rrf2 family iron-sulfur cluster assembly transcriptional regulator
MVDLVCQPKGKPVSLTKIAKHQGVTPKYLGKIFLKLQLANLVESKKGPGGGYFIERDPNTISLSEIMRAVGEANVPVFCVAEERKKDCARMKDCPTRPFWDKLRKMINRFFDDITLYDIAKQCRRGKFVCQ